MIVERINEEVIIRLPASVDSGELRIFLNFAHAKELHSSMELLLQLAGDIPAEKKGRGEITGNNRDLQQDIIAYFKSLTPPDNLQGVLQTFIETLEAKAKDALLYPLTNRLEGAVQFPPDFDYKEALQEAIEKKYGT